MPLREYQCRGCEARFEVLEFGSDAPPTHCERCGAPLERLFSAPSRAPRVFDRPVGRTCCGRDERCDTPPCGEGGSCCQS